MSQNNILDLPDNKLKEIFLEVDTIAGKKHSLIDEEYISEALIDYRDKFITASLPLTITPSEDYKYLKSKAVEIIKDAVAGSFRGYNKYKAKILELYQETKDWDKVITTAVYRDVEIAQEAFIDVVEEIYQTQIKDAKHLQELTAISEDKGETLEGLEDTLINSRYSKYTRALSIILKNGGTYSDLLNVEPKEYGLPETWEGTLGKNKTTSISWALIFHFCLSEPSRSLLPNIRNYAKDIKAPYSVLLEAYLTANRVGYDNVVDEIKNLSNNTGLSTYDKVMSLIKNSLSDKFRAEIEALSEEEKRENHYLPVEPEIPKTKKAIQKAIDVFVEEESVDIGLFLDYLGLLYDSWGGNAINKDLADQLREEINYTDIDGELNVLDTDEVVIDKIKKILYSQPVEVLNSLWVFGIGVSEDKAKENVDFQLNILPDVVIKNILEAIPMESNTEKKKSKYYHDIRSSYPKQYKALRFYERFKDKIKPEEIIDRVEEILK